MQTQLVTSEVLPSLVSSSLIAKEKHGTPDWKGMPADWSDIRLDCPENSIALYAAHPSDFSAYDNLGFTATCTGGYNVFIDEVQYGTTYASGATCSITWSTSGITTGDDITTPNAMKAHKIWIEPATEGAEITAFKMRRVASSGREAQGLLWAHFNIDNVINLNDSFAAYSNCYEPLMLAATAKNNVIKCSGLIHLGQVADLGNYASNVEYLPNFDLQNNTMKGEGAFNVLTTALLNQVNLKNGTISGSIMSFSHNATKLKKIITKNINIIPTNCESAFRNNQSLEELPPNIDYSNATKMSLYITNAVALKDTVLDVSAAKNLTTIGCYGTSQYFMNGFKGLRVSNEAPFDSSTSPQINVSYTGMDRQALVTLFNDLPTVTGGQIINIVGCTGTSDLTADDKAIATDKGWTLTL